MLEKMKVPEGDLKASQKTTTKKTLFASQETNVSWP